MSNTDMKSLEAFEKNIVAEDEARGEARAYNNIAIEFIKLGQNTLEDIARICHMTLEQVQALAASLKASRTNPSIINSSEAFEKIGMSEGESRGIATVAINLLKSGKCSFNDIMEACNMTLEQVRYLDAFIKLEEQNSISEEEALRTEAEEEYELRHDGGYDDNEFDSHGHVKLSS